MTLQGVARLLVQEAIVNDTDLLKAFSEASGIPFHNIGDFRIEQEAIDKVTAKVALRHRIVPLTFQDGILRLAVSRVPNLTTVDGLRMVLDAGIEFVLCPESDVSMSLTHFYGPARDHRPTIAEAEAMPQDEEDDDIAVQTQETGMVRFINLIIAEAIRMDCTDIHIEPFENTLRLRYRIDGILQESVAQGRRKTATRRPPSKSWPPWISPSTAAARRRIKVRCGNSDYDLRVSVLPTGGRDPLSVSQPRHHQNRSRHSGPLALPAPKTPSSPSFRMASSDDRPHGSAKPPRSTLLARLNKTGTKIILWRTRSI